MMNHELFRQLPEVLLPWYDQSHRDLPWRKNRDPYHIWLSEIMLQQTRVEAVKGYYNRFLQEIPDISALASADDELLHKLWEGLGYYSRVRNLKKAAVTIMEQYNGQMPRDYKSVLGLSGIGEYTAGAICSIAFEQKTPAVDGNVLRVAARICDDDTPIDLPTVKVAVKNQLAEVYPDRAGDFTQALMELGATVCGPNRKPVCDVCPCMEFCLGRQRGTAENLPVKLPKKQRKQEDKTVFILNCDGKYALQKRPDKGLLAGLWEFPNCSGMLGAEQALTYVQNLGVSPKELCRQLERTHIFTHVQWNMRGFYIDVKEMPESLCWMTEEEIEERAALPTAFRQFWEEHNYV